MATDQIPVTDISIILWSIKTFIQFMLSNPKFILQVSTWKNIHWIKKELEDMVQSPFPQQNQTV